MFMNHHVRLGVVNKYRSDSEEDSDSDDDEDDTETDDSNVDDDVDSNNNSNKNVKHFVAVLQTRHISQAERREKHAVDRLLDIDERDCFLGLSHSMTSESGCINTFESNTLGPWNHNNSFKENNRNEDTSGNFTATKFKTTDFSSNHMSNPSNSFSTSYILGVHPVSYSYIPNNGCYRVYKQRLREQQGLGKHRSRLDVRFPAINQLKNKNQIGSAKASNEFCNSTVSRPSYFDNMTTSADCAVIGPADSEEAPLWNCDEFNSGVLRNKSMVDKGCGGLEIYETIPHQHSQSKPRLVEDNTTLEAVISSNWLTTDPKDISHSTSNEVCARKSSSTSELSTKRNEKRTVKNLEAADALHDNANKFAIHKPTPDRCNENRADYYASNNKDMDSHTSNKKSSSYYSLRKLQPICEDSRSKTNEFSNIDDTEKTSKRTETKNNRSSESLDLQPTTVVIRSSIRAGGDQPQNIVAISGKKLASAFTSTM